MSKDIQHTTNTLTDIERCLKELEDYNKNIKTDNELEWCQESLDFLLALTKDLKMEWSEADEEYLLTGEEYHDYIELQEDVEEIQRNLEKRNETIRQLKNTLRSYHKMIPSAIVEDYDPDNPVEWREEAIDKPYVDSVKTSKDVRGGFKVTVEFYGYQNAED